MSEEVVIKVKQESQGNALSEVAARIEQLKARIAELNRLEANYAQKGITGTGDIKQERAALTRELGTLEKTQAEEKKRGEAAVTRDTRARLAAEKEMTEEHRRREAVVAARGRVLGRGLQAAESAAGAAGLPGVGLMSAGIWGALAAGIGAYVGKAVSEAVEKVAAIRQSEEKAGFAAGRRRRILGRSNPLQGESEASSEVGENAGALEAAEDRKGKFKDTQPLRDFFRGAFGFETSSQKKERENDLEIARLKQNLPGDAAAAEMKFRGGAGGAEMEARRAGLAYDMQGKRFAEDKVAAMKEYSRIVTSLGGEHATAEGKKLAEEAATDLIRERQRERAGNIAGMVDARTGTRGTAQLARFAAGLDDPERAGRVFAAALKPVINEAAQPPLHDWMTTGGRR